MAIIAVVACICTLAGGVAYAMCYVQPELRQKIAECPSARKTALPGPMRIKPFETQYRAFPIKQHLDKSYVEKGC